MGVVVILKGVSAHRINPVSAFHIIEPDRLIDKGSLSTTELISCISRANRRILNANSIVNRAAASRRMQTNLPKQTPAIQLTSIRTIPIPDRNSLARAAKEDSF